MAVFYLVCFGTFVNYYFTVFPEVLQDDSMFGSLDDLKETLIFAEDVNPYDDTVYVLGRVQPYIYTLLALDVDPYTFNEKKILSYDDYVKVYDKYRFRLDKIMPECVYVFTDVHNIPDEIEDFDFESKQFDHVKIYYPASPEP